MLTKLTLHNFRGFAHHAVPFKSATVIVGKNNAGKSTIVEALRLVAIVVARHRSLGFREGPNWIKAGRAQVGLQPSLKNMEITFDGMRHHYEAPPSMITATFHGGQSICVYIAEGERIHAVLKDATGRSIKTREKAIAAAFPSMAIMPQVAPLLKQDQILADDYVKSAMSSILAPQHFRNQLNVRFDLFPEFCRTVAETWPGVMIDALIGQGGQPGAQLHLEVRNEDFVGEVGLMGHGLQMWLQTIWFLTLAREAQTVILDEPDVYMHPDLQRRIFRLLRIRKNQHIITTHSIEILSETETDEILVIDKRDPQSRFATSVPMVQQLIDGMGSIHNIQISRLWQARRLVVVEGKDLALLKAFQNAMYPDSPQPIDAIPTMSIGGWGGWPYAVGSAMLRSNAMDEDITVYCILDSDYHTHEEIAERYAQADKRRISLRIWSRKEIENYLLLPSVVLRAIAKSLPEGAVLPTVAEVAEVIQKLAANSRNDVLDALATEILCRNRKLSVASANKLARKRLNESTKTSAGILQRVPGKDMISKLSSWSQNRFGVSFNALTLARSIQRVEIDTELANVITAIEHSKPFSRSWP